MNSDMETYYDINKFFLLQIGGWPYQKKVLKILIPCLLSMILYSVYVIEALLLYETWGDVDIAIECVITITPVMVSNIKLINIVINNDKFRRLLQLMNEHWKLFHNKNERHILRYYANIGRKITTYVAVYFVTTMIFYLLIPLIPKILDIIIPLNESRPLAYVFPAEYKVDKVKFYYPIVFHSYVTTITTIIILFTIDTTYIVCVLHACSLFTAISQNLKNITKDTKIIINYDKKKHTGSKFHLLMEEHDAASNDYLEFMMCLKKHQLALEHAQTLDSIFTHATFVILFLNVLLLSIVGIQLINNLGRTEEVIRYIIYSFAVFIHLVCMCIPGQLLIDRSTEIFNEAYSSEWYTFSLKTKKLLRVLFYRSFVPCTLTAGKMFVMSMTMCSSVLQTAMSYFTAFLSIK
ncbi:hypothetical protein PUN28_017984 [Cardiocondyla obscurior]|uniref:Odorant receptor n=5 Tax=Cardiocondyla obscurior TaxID=286306 RepID=A0AAW2EGB3_9HYME